MRMCDICLQSRKEVVLWSNYKFEAFYVCEICIEDNEKEEK